MDSNNTQMKVAEYNLVNKNGFYLIVTLLVRRWVLLFIIAFVAGFFGFLYANSLKPTYQSRLTFSLDAGASEGLLSGALSLAAQFGFASSSGNNMFEGDNIIEIMKSRKIVESVFLTSDTFNNQNSTLADFYYQISGLKEIHSKNASLKLINFPFAQPRHSFSYRQDSVLNLLFQDFVAKSLVASRPDKKLGIYEIKVISPNEKFTKIFTERLVLQTSNFYTELTSKKEKETLEILEKRVSLLKSTVSSGIDDKVNIQDANLNPAFAKAQAPALKFQYNVQAYGEAYKEMFKTLELARYQYLKKIPLLQIIDDARYPMKLIKVSRLKTALIFALLALVVTAVTILIPKLLRISAK